MHDVWSWSLAWSETCTQSRASHSFAFLHSCIVRIALSFARCDRKRFLPHAHTSQHFQPPQPYMRWPYVEHPLKSNWGGVALSLGNQSPRFPWAARYGPRCILLVFNKIPITSCHRRILVSSHSQQIIESFKGPSRHVQTSNPSSKSRLDSISWSHAWRKWHLCSLWMDKSNLLQQRISRNFQRTSGMKHPFLGTGRAVSNTGFSTWSTSVFCWIS